MDIYTRRECHVKMNLRLNKNNHELVTSSDIVEKPYQINTYLIGSMKRNETI